MAVTDALRPSLEVDGMPVSFGFLSTYPPTQCGLATFTAALRAQVVAAGHEAGVVRVLERAEPGIDPTVVAQMIHDDAEAVARTAAALNDFDVVVVQHEYGIYPGADGENVVSVLEQLTVPSIVVLHTVLVDPTSHQRQVLEAVVRSADAVITMTATAQRRLVHHYVVDETKVVVIPHGAADGRSAREVRREGEAPLMLTWGLLGPGKGIERVIDALPSLRDLVPTPRYVVVGDTHPRVLEREGESYRSWLMARAHRLGVGDMVTFNSGHFDVASLDAIIRAADVVILPYDSREQVTSGVLIEAVTARRPVIATGFAHAVELLGRGAGLVVDHDDPDAMVAAIRQVLCEPAEAARMSARSALLAPGLLWPAVAARYCALADQLIGSEATAVA